MKKLFMRTLKITSSMIIFTVAFFCFSVCCCCISVITDDTPEPIQETTNYDEELAEIKEQYEQQIAELNNTIETKDEEINNLKQQMDEQNEIIFDKQEEIYELENQLETTNNNYYISHDEYIAGNDSDNDGDNQYDNEYADPDRIYIDENGNIIYDDHNNYNYPSYDVDDNESSNYGDYYIARGNSYYHNSPNCKYLQGADTDRVTEEEAISNGKHECNCVKYGY